ncbi:hypothetical protein EON79_20360 [bacterium]|nr:MAG: hypothetical protein EON79_20360 [bacterium]
MPPGVLGRTNRAFPPVWLALGVPSAPEETEPMLALAREAGVPLDITAQPGLWGGRMRGSEDFFSVIGPSHHERATEHSHAIDLTQAHLIETLSAIGREWIDIYWLRIRRPLEEFQIDGALEALESARQDGHVRYLGLACDGPGLSALSVWQFHDAFELLMVDGSDENEAYRTLSSFAAERRVGIVHRVASTAEITAFPSLVTVRNERDVRSALEAGA